MSATGSFSVIGQRNFNQLEATTYPSRGVVLDFPIALNQILNQAGADTPTTLLPGSVMAHDNTTGLLRLVDSTGAGSGKIPVGVYVGAPLETAVAGPISGAVTLSGTFSELLFAGTDSYVTFDAALTALNINIQAPALEAPPPRW